MSSNRYSTFGKEYNQMHSSGSMSGAGYGGYGQSSQDRVQENLNKAMFLVNEPESNNMYMDGFNIGFSQPTGGRLGTAPGIGMRSQYSASVSDLGDIDNQNRNNVNAGARSPSLGGMEVVGTMDIGVPTRRSGRVAGGGSSNQNNSHIQQNQRPMTQGAFPTGPRNTFDNFEQEFGRNDTGNRGVSQNLLSQAGSQFGDDDALSSHYQGLSEYGGISNIGGLADQVPDNKQATGGSRRQQVLARQGITDTQNKARDNKGGNNNLPPTQKPKPQNYGLFLGDGPARSRSEAPPKNSVAGATIDSNEDKRPDLARDRSNPNRAIFLGRDNDNQSMRSGLTAEPPVQIKKQNVDSDILEDKSKYISSKRREEIDELKVTLKKEKQRMESKMDDFNKQSKDLQEQQSEEISQIEKTHKQTLESLVTENDKILSVSLKEQIQIEAQKLETIYKAAIQSQQRQHEETMSMLKTSLNKEKITLEEQLSSQSEMKTVLERVQKRTIEISEVVSSSLKQREDELKRKEIDMARMERDLIQDEQVYIEIEEKRLQDEERKLQQQKDALLKLKQQQNQEITRLREQRTQVIDSCANYEANLKTEERSAKESLVQSRKQLDQENEKRSQRNRLIEVEIQNKEAEIENALSLRNQERLELEQEIRESFLREIQSTKIDIENRKKTMADNDHELRKQQRMLEKRNQLIQIDHEQLKARVTAFQVERDQFEELAIRIQETSNRLSSERDKVFEEKAIFDEEKDKLDRFKHDIDVERSILQSDWARLEEFEHELTHRENMLKMLQFNYDKKGMGITGLLPSYTSCPGLKSHTTQFDNQQQQDHQSHQEASFYQDQQQQQQQQMVSGQQFYRQPEIIRENRFNYSQYMADLQKKLGGSNAFKVNNRFSNITEEADQYSQQQRSGANSRLNGSNISEGGFRQNILARLGNAHLEDSQVHSQPDDVYSGDFASANKVEQHLGLHNQANQFIDDYDDSEF